MLDSESEVYIGEQGEQFQDLVGQLFLCVAFPYYKALCSTFLYYMESIFEERLWKVSKILIYRCYHLFIWYIDRYPA